MTDQPKAQRHRRLPYVEETKCPQGEGNHTLVCNSQAVVTCRHCKKTWAELDQEVRPRINGTSEILRAR